MRKFYISFAIAFVLVIHLVSLFAMADSYTFSHSEDADFYATINSTKIGNSMVSTESFTDSGSDLVSGNPGKYSIASKLYYTPIR